MIKDGDKLSWLSQASRKYSNSTFSNGLENQYIRLVNTNNHIKGPSLQNIIENEKK